MSYSNVTDEDVRNAITNIRRKHSKIIKFLDKHHSEFSELSKAIIDYTYELNIVLEKYKPTALSAPDTEDGDRLKTRIQLVSYDLKLLEKLSDKLYEAGEILDDFYL